MATYRDGDAERARRLRRDQTDAERKLWSILRDRRCEGHKFVRQLPVGRYVADFACRDANLIIEVDGSQHLESARDEVRTRQLEAFGYRVVRFWNSDVLTNIEGVYEAIRDELLKSAAPGRLEVRSPLPSGERDRVRGPSASPEAPGPEPTP